MADKKDEVKILEYVEDVAVLKLPVPGFEELSLDEKMVAYHLWHAAAAGDSITWDQNYRHGLLLKHVFFGLVDCKDAIEPAAYKKIETFTKKLLINHGNHDMWSTKKFTPPFTIAEFQDAVAAAKRKKGFSGSFPPEFERILFDEHFEEYLTQKNPPPGQDIITASFNNFYQDLTLQDLDGFEDKNPNNSTVVKDQETGELTEKIWRAGNMNASSGLYASFLKRVCYHLGKTASYSNPEDKKHLLLLKQYLEEGDASLFDDFNIAWLGRNPAVDSILGFIEEYRDPRGRKGLFEGMAFFVDRKTTPIIQKIAAEAAYLEEHTPWNKEYRKTWTSIPVSNAITLLTGTGGAGPTCWAGVNLPNSQSLREKHGSKSIVLANVTAASREVFAKQSTEEFYETKQEADWILKYTHLRGPVVVTLHEIVGHGSGKSKDSLEKDTRDYLQEYYSTMEEARAELCMLHHIWNPKLQEIGVVPDKEMPKTVYLGYVVGDLAQLRMLEKETEIHEDHLRATHLIVQYLIRKVKCCAFYKGKNGKTYGKVLDYDKMRLGVAELLAELQRIKSEGDYESLKKLVNEYARHFDPALRDEIVLRCRKIHAPSSYAYLMPEPKLVDDVVGEVSNVVLEYPSDLIDQAKRWDTSAD